MFQEPLIATDTLVDIYVLASLPRRIFTLQKNRIRYIFDSIHCRMETGLSVGGYPCERPI